MRGMHNARPVADNGMLWCRDCEKFLPPDEFAVDRRDRNGRSTKCRGCAKVKRERHKAKVGRAAIHDYDLRRHYNITLEQYNEMLEAQGGVCAICKRPNRQWDKKLGAHRRLAVDHNHKTGRVRGLLCTACNRALGNFKDSPEVLDAAARYLRG